MYIIAAVLHAAGCLLPAAALSRLWYELQQLLSQRPFVSCFFVVARRARRAAPMCTTGQRGGVVSENVQDCHIPQGVWSPRRREMPLV
mmetsp:Transcript_5586/g.18623  ORF Transcript_5586/g.18623 Transcript_5586/m.18623 type:complete len:88 (-) Transcript_5586:133-396(-)